MGATRLRSKFGLITWHSRGNGKKMTELRDGVLNRLSQTQIANNTTRGLTPGLINPALGEAGGRVPLPGEDDQGAEDQGSDEEQGNDEEQENVEGHRNEEEHSPAIGEIAQGPSRGNFHPPRAPGNIMKRKRNDTPEQGDSGDHNRKKTRTMAPPAYDTLPKTSYGGDHSRTLSWTQASSARRENLGIPQTQPVQHYDAHAIQDFARYGIDLLKRKHDDSEADAQPRKRARTAMADEEEYIRASPTAIIPSVRERRQRQENAEFMNHLDPALFHTPANRIPSEQQEAAASAVTDSRPRVQPDRRRMARPVTPAHQPRTRAPVSAETSRQDRGEATATPRVHLLGARAPNTTETRLQDLLEASTAREAPQAQLPSARAAVTTYASLQDHEGPENILRRQRAHLPGARTRNTDTPETHHPGRTEAPRAHLLRARGPNTAETRSLGQARREAILAQLLGASARGTTDTHNSGPSEAIMARDIPRAHLPSARAHGTAETRCSDRTGTSSIPREAARPYLPIPRALLVPVQADYISAYSDAVEARRHTTRQQGPQELEHNAPTWAVGDYFNENAWRNEDGTGNLTSFDWTDGSENLNVSGRNSSGIVSSFTTFGSGNCYATYAGSTVGTAQGSKLYEDWCQDA